MNISEQLNSCKFGVATHASDHGNKTTPPPNTHCELGHAVYFQEESCSTDLLGQKSYDESANRTFQLSQNEDRLHLSEGSTSPGLLQVIYPSVSSKIKEEVEDSIDDPLSLLNTSSEIKYEFPMQLQDTETISQEMILSEEPAPYLNDLRLQIKQEVDIEIDKSKQKLKSCVVLLHKLSSQFIERGIVSLSNESNSEECVINRFSQYDQLSPKVGRVMYCQLSEQERFSNDNVNSALSRSRKVSVQCQDSPSSKILGRSRNKSTNSSASKKKPFSCNKCPKSFRLKSRLKMQLLKHSVMKAFSCGHCSASFARKDNLKRHVMTHTEKKPFTCNECSKSFLFKNKLIIHMLKHAGKTPFSCSHCSLSFPCKSNLENHVMTHTGEKPFACSECTKSFNRRYSLKSHMLTHGSDKLFSCSHCSASFALKRHLKTHIVTHNREKHVFSRSHSSTSLAKKCTLKTHRLTHAGEKSFVCSECPKSYVYHSSLRNHRVKHHNRNLKPFEEPLVCRHCSTYFAHKWNLEKHLPTHIGSKPFSCCECSKSFVNRSSWRYHEVRCRNRNLKP